MKKTLTEKELNAFSGLINMDIKALSGIKGYLDTKKVRSALIREEFVFLSKGGSYTKKQIIGALMEKYGMSKSYIERIAYSRESKKTERCQLCGKPLTSRQYSTNKGICDKCSITKIKKTLDHELDH